MSAERLRERLAELRSAGALLRARPIRETLDSLAAVFDGWSDERSAWRRDLSAELPAACGFSPEGVAEGLRRGLADWSGDHFRRLVESELGTEAHLDDPGGEFVVGFDLTATILGGAIPMPTLLALLAPLALRSPVIGRSASRDVITARHVVRSVAQCDELLGRCIDCVEFPHDDDPSMAQLLTADCVVAAGSDETVAALAARTRPTRRFVPYGHRLSVALVGGGALHGSGMATAARNLALDVALWDQQGCLSPVAVYATGGDGAKADSFAEELATALSEMATRLPRGTVPRQAAAQIALERSEAEMRSASGRRVALHVGDGWTVIREDALRFRHAPLHRFVRVHSAPGPVELLAALAPLGPHLAAVGSAGFGPELRGLARRLAELGASRVCELGRMQSPPLAWRHDNRPVLVPLARYATLEAHA